MEGGEGEKSTEALPQTHLRLWHCHWHMNGKWYLKTSKWNGNEFLLKKSPSSSFSQYRLFCHNEKIEKNERKRKRRFFFLSSGVFAFAYVYYFTYKMQMCNKALNFVYMSMRMGVSNMHLPFQTKWFVKTLIALLIVFAFSYCFYELLRKIESSHLQK